MGAVSCTPALVDDHSALRNKLLKSIVYIEADTDDNSYQGTGWMLDDGQTVVTAGHLTAHLISGKPLTNVHLTFPNGHEQIPLSFVQGKEDIGWFTMSKKIPGWRGLHLARKMPVEGSEVFSMGFPGLYRDVMWRQGYVASYTQHNLDTFGWRMVCILPIIPGDSGSPVVNGQGNVVGLVIEQDSRNPSFTLCTPLDAMKRELKRK
jgi:hypothetical protein